MQAKIQKERIEYESRLTVSHNEMTSLYNQNQ